jgi:hypothetical protein
LKPSALPQARYSGLVAGVVAVARSGSLCAGCTMQSDPPAAASEISGPGPGQSPGPTGTPAAATTQPMLVDVDANRTMSATPGKGVGVFTQYRTGGHWSVWWTCDTNTTHQPCNFEVSVTVETGSIAGATGQGLQAGDTLTQPGGQEIDVQSTTTTAVVGVTFDTVVPSGTTAIITLDAKLGEVSNPSYLFFVQDGRINGGYSGTLTDPLMLEPSSP